MAQNRLTMTFLFCPPYDIIILAGQENHPFTLRACPEPEP